MRTIYIDSNFRCYAKPADGLRAVESRYFDGKCQTYIEGYRLIPNGERWTREDGEVFEGEMATPWKDYSVLELAQSAYEESLAELQDMRAALTLLGISPIEEVTDNG